MRIDDVNPPAEIPANPRLVVLSVIIFMFLGLVSLGMAVFGGGTYSDSYSHEADRLWGVVAMIEGGFMFLASIAAIASLFLRGKTIWRVTIILLVLSLAGVGVLIWAGFGMLADEKLRGSDAIGIPTFIFVVVIPALIGAAAFAGGVCLRAARSSRRMAIALK